MFILRGTTSSFAFARLLYTHVRPSRLPARQQIRQPALVHCSTISPLLRVYPIMQSSATTRTDSMLFALASAALLVVVAISRSMYGHAIAELTRP